MKETRSSHVGRNKPYPEATEVANPRSDLRYPPFLCLLASGLVIRVILIFAYFPAIMMSYDSPRFARIDSMPIYGDFWMPAGYPIFLKVVRSISDQLWFTIAVQHALGLSVGVLLYLAARRLGLKRAISALISAVPFLSGDHLYLEHLVTADNFLIFLGAAGLTAAVYGLVPTVSMRWLASASALLATAALARSVGVVLLPVLVFCTIIWVRGSIRERAMAMAIALLPGIAVFGLYACGRVLSHGQYLGLVDMAGWNLYSRVAPFADCGKFDPPPRMEILCEQRAPVDRPGPFGYVWDLQSVPRKNFELGPNAAAHMKKFATRAILHQPLDYCRAVVVDLIRYVSPSFYSRDYSGQPPEIISFGWRDVEVEKLVVDAMSRGYRGTTVHWHGARMLALYQNVFCVRGTLILALAIFTVFAALIGRDSLRLGAVLFGLSAFGLYFVPVLTVSYDFRYGIPPETFLVVSGLLGVVALGNHYSLRRITKS